MADTTFTNGVTLSDAAWFQDVNDFRYSPATQAQQETGTSTSVAVTPGRQQYHPSASKAWALFGVTGNILGSYNVSSITDSGTGVAVVNWNVDFSAATYAVVATIISDAAANTTSMLHVQVDNTNFLAGSCVVSSRRVSDGAFTDPSAYSVVAFGDQ